ncbi:hypothetical protein ACTGVC_01195 [Streptococcus suis]
MINFGRLNNDQHLRWDIAEAKYLIHFNSYFPTLLLFAWEILEEEHVVKLEKIVDDCIQNNEAYPIPEDYHERMY